MWSLAFEKMEESFLQHATAKVLEIIENEITAYIKKEGTCSLLDSLLCRYTLHMRSDRKTSEVIFSTLHSSFCVIESDAEEDLDCSSSIYRYDTMRYLLVVIINTIFLK